MLFEDGMYDLLIESCILGIFDINIIYLTKLLLLVSNNDKELFNIYIFNFGDYYLRMIYYFSVKYSWKDYRDDL